MVTIELFGVPRLRAGLSEVRVEARTVAEALAALERACPALAGSVVSGGELGAGYRIALNGRSFVAEPSLAIADGDVLVLVSAQAGG